MISGTFHVMSATFASCRILPFTLSQMRALSIRPPALTGRTAPIGAE